MTSNYFRAVVKEVNVSEEAHDKQRKNSRTVLIKVSSLSNNRSNQSNPSLDWIMFHKIAHMYRDIGKKETVKAALLIQGLHVNFNSTKDVGASPATLNLSMPPQPKIPLDPTTVPEYLKYI